MDICPRPVKHAIDTVEPGSMVKFESEMARVRRGLMQGVVRVEPGLRHVGVRVVPGWTEVRAGSRTGAWVRRVSQGWAKWARR